MKVLMISIDRGLLGENQLGDVLARHKKYGESCEKLDIIVLSQGEKKINKISDKVTAYSSSSKDKLRYYFDGVKLGQKLFQDNKYDLVVCQTPFVTGMIGSKLKKEFGCKLLVHFHGDFWNNKNWLKEKRRNILMLFISKMVVRSADAIRVMSRGQKEKLVSEGIKAEKIRVISTPVDLLKYQKDGDFGDKKEKVILHIGRDDEVKDYNTLIKAYQLVDKKFPDVVFNQVGADSKVKKAMAENNFNRVNVLGRKSAEELIDLFHKSNILVLSSISESFGKVLVEANACGKPLVSTTTTGAKEIIEDGKNGYLVPIGDYEALADKIIDLLNNPDKAKRMGEAGLELVKEKYGDNSQKIIEYWKDIISW